MGLLRVIPISISEDPQGSNYQINIWPKFLFRIRSYHSLYIFFFYFKFKCTIHNRHLGVESLPRGLLVATIIHEKPWKCSIPKQDAIRTEQFTHEFKNQLFNFAEKVLKKCGQILRLIACIQRCIAFLAIYIRASYRCRCASTCVFYATCVWTYTARVRLRIFSQSFI